MSESTEHKIQVGLFFGKGVEDIAIELSCDVSIVREEVIRLRETGQLAKIYEPKT